MKNAISAGTQPLLQSNVSCKTDKFTKFSTVEYPGIEPLFKIDTKFSIYPIDLNLVVQCA